MTAVNHAVNRKKQQYSQTIPANLIIFVTVLLSEHKKHPGNVDNNVLHRLMFYITEWLHRC